MPIADIPLLLTSEIGRLILTFVYCRFSGKHDAAIQKLKNEALKTQIATMQKQLDKTEERLHSLEIFRSHCPAFKDSKD